MKLKLLHEHVNEQRLDCFVRCTIVLGSSESILRRETVENDFLLKFSEFYIHVINIELFQNDFFLLTLTMLDLTYRWKEVIGLQDNDVLMTALKENNNLQIFYSNLCEIDFRGIKSFAIFFF